MRTPLAIAGNGVGTQKNVLQKITNAVHPNLRDMVRQKILIFYQNTLNGNEISTFGNLIVKPGGVALLRENVAKNTFGDDLATSKKPLKSVRLSISHELTDSCGWTGSTPCIPPGWSAMKQQCSMGQLPLSEEATLAAGCKNWVQTNATNKTVLHKKRFIMRRWEKSVKVSDVISLWLFDFSIFADTNAVPLSEPTHTYFKL